MTDHNAPTPRTDAKSFYAYKAHSRRQCVLSGFARELERELAVVEKHLSAAYAREDKLKTQLAALKHDAAKRSETQREGK